MPPRGHPATPRHPHRPRPCALLTAVLLAAGLLPAGSGPAGAAPRIDRKARIQTLRRRLKSLVNRRAAARAELRQTKRTQVRLADQLNESYQRLEVAQEALAASGARLRGAEEAVRRATEELRAAEARLSLQQRRFGRRINASYQEGPVTYLDVLLGARDLSDLLDRQYYVTLVTGRDAALVRDLRAAQQAVSRERRRLVERRQEQAEAHRENAGLVERVREQAGERRRLLRAVREERALQEQRLEELEQDSEEIQRALERELVRRQSNPRAFRNLPRWSGRLYMPANGPVTSGFGYRYHPVLRYRRLHTGLDIGAAWGSGVYAAADGEVFFASWRGGYGLCIILLHGGGMSTLYGHLARVQVRPGDTVRRGQRLGAVGSTGLSTGPHLHFEVRRNGAPVNPR